MSATSWIGWSATCTSAAFRWTKRNGQRFNGWRRVRNRISKSTCANGLTARVKSPEKERLNQHENRSRTFPPHRRNSTSANGAVDPGAKETFCAYPGMATQGKTFSDWRRKGVGAWKFDTMKPPLAVLIHHHRPAGVPKATPRRPGRRIIFGRRVLPPVIRYTIPYELQS